MSASCGKRSFAVNAAVVETWYPDPAAWVPDDDSHLQEPITDNQLTDNRIPDIVSGLTE
jgi:hypothetical protein